MKLDLVVADNLVRAHKLSGRSMKVLPICSILKVSFGGCKIDCSCMYCHCTELNVRFFIDISKQNCLDRSRRWLIWLERMPSSTSSVVKVVGSDTAAVH